jgi:hypothetical protein
VLRGERVVVVFVEKEGGDETPRKTHLPSGFFFFFFGGACCSFCSFGFCFRSKLEVGAFITKAERAVEHQRRV